MGPSPARGAGDGYCPAMAGWHFTVEEGAQRRPVPPDLAAVLLVHGSMELEWYAPRGTDPQSPHDQDELYIIGSGTGTFVRDRESARFGPGDVIFVPAGMEHRFVDFTDDFGTWVVFWGPPGGEAPEAAAS